MCAPEDWLNFRFTVFNYLVCEVYFRWRSEKGLSEYGDMGVPPEKRGFMNYHSMYYIQESVVINCEL